MTGLRILWRDSPRWAAGFHLRPGCGCAFARRRDQVADGPTWWQQAVRRPRAAGRIADIW